MKPRGRTGFSLLEVLLATGILLVCSLVLCDLATVGRQHVTDAADLTTAQLLCETKLNEILAGVELGRPVRKRAFREAPGWVYSVEMLSVDVANLVSVRVTVEEDVSEVEQSRNRRPVTRFSLSRWMRNPGGGSNSAEAPAEAPGAAASSGAGGPLPLEGGFEGGELP